MQAQSVFESVLYAPDLPAIESFYHDVFGLDVLSRSDALVAFRCGNGVLLVFNPTVTRGSGRGVPTHGTDGPGHIAFAMPMAELDRWKQHLASMGIPIEMEVAWEQGGTSIYVRDPAANSVELAPLTLWGGGWG